MRRIWILLTVAVLSASCGDDDVALVDPPLPTGSIQVTTATLGWDTDVDGFGLYLDGEDVGHLEPEGALMLPDLAPGSHELLLNDVASNCVAGENPLQAVVLHDSTVVAPFEIDCEPLPYGAEDLGNWGYQSVTIAGINNRGQVIVDLCSECASNMMRTDASFLWENGHSDELETFPLDINDRGQILLYVAELWEDGVTTLLPLSDGEDLNERGEVAGAIFPSEPDSACDDRFSARHAALWRDGVIIDLGVLPGYGGSHALHLNDRSQVVGYAWECGCGADHERGERDHYYCPRTGFLWDDGTLTELPSIMPRAINNKGQIIGQLPRSGPDSVAVLWDNGLVTEMWDPGWSRSVAKAINDSGQVIGNFRIGDVRHGFRYDEGVLTALSKEGYLASSTSDINEHGLVVGYLRDEIQSSAYTWAGDLIMPLPPLPGGSWTGSPRVNDFGQIVGRAGLLESDDEYVVLWEKQKPDPD